MQTRVKAIFIAFALFTSCIVWSGTIFNVNFEGTNFVVDSECPTGAPPDYPQYAPSLIIYSPSFDSQVARPGYLRFDPDGHFTSGVHSVSWKYNSTNQNTYGGWPNMAVSFSDSTVFVPDGFFYINNSLISTAPVPFNEVHCFTVIIDLDYYLASFIVNDTQYTGNVSITNTATLDYVQFQRPGNNYAMIDDFRWEVTYRPIIQLVNNEQIVWQSESGLLYRAQSSTNLLDEAWSNIGDAVLATGNVSAIQIINMEFEHEYLRILSEE